MKAFKLLGAILLIAGTTIGAGMLALPTILSLAGFFPSLLLFLVVWLMMLASAWFLLDVNLALPGEANFISMAERSLGKIGKWLTWLFYLLLLYSLTAAYIAASAPLFGQAISFVTGWSMPYVLSYFILPILFAGFVYLGTKGVDLINRFLMIGLIIAYGLLVMFVPPYIQPKLLFHSDFPQLKLAVTVLFTSFGYHIVIPSLTTYLEHDKKSLRIAILAGSLIPLVVYIIWQLIVLGSVPLEALQKAWERGEAATVPLAQVLKNPAISLAAPFFSFFAIVTSFLGVALSLSDFLTDGLRLKKTWEGKWIAIGATFAPPLVFVFTYQRGFYLALEHAGTIVAILLGIIPALMARTLKHHHLYKTVWGKTLIFCVIVLCCAVIVFDFIPR
jgi:tyrosine-specific transport protein